MQIIVFLITAALCIFVFLLAASIFLGIIIGFFKILGGIFAFSAHILCTVVIIGIFIYLLCMIFPFIWDLIAHLWHFAVHGFRALEHEINSLLI